MTMNYVQISGLQEKLAMEKKMLFALKRKLDKSLKNIPDGVLHVKTYKGKHRYKLYKINEMGEKEERYIHSDETRLLNSLAQRDYEIKLSRLIERRLKQLSGLADEFRDDEIDRVFEDMCESRRCLVHPIEPTLKQKREEWKDETYEGKPYYDNNPEIYTKRGERVRSKSEKIIADMLADANLEYRYEYPVMLEGMGMVYPDFTILHPENLKEIYWEHCGLMSDMEYSAGAIKKIDCYIKNGLYPGDRLILTFEGSGTGLDVRSIGKIIEHYF